MYIGIIAEWNPFHEGHRHLIRTARSLCGDAPVACAMSGAFVQRGEPAVFDKWSRARWAVRCGVSLAAELPAASVLQSADRFASAGVLLLAGLGVTHLAFGTESMEKEELLAAARWSLSEDFRQRLHEALAAGVPYARAANLAAASRFPELEDGLSRPNNLLGIQYARTILQYQLPVEILPVRRPADPPISATGIRKTIADGMFPSFIPEENRDELESLLTAGACTDYGRYDDACLLSARMQTKEALLQSGLFSEGLENRWHRESGCASYRDMLDAVKSRRYLYSRLRRIGAALLIGESGGRSPFAVPAAPSYARLLALRKKESALLRHARLPVVAKFTDGLRRLPEEGKRQLLLEARTTDIQSFCMKSPVFRIGRADYIHSPEIL